MLRNNYSFSLSNRTKNHHTHFFITKFNKAEAWMRFFLIRGILDLNGANTA